MSLDLVTVSGATWRRLKISAEVQSGHRLPRLPATELVRLLGLLALVRDGKVFAVDSAHESAGLDEARRAGVDPGDESKLAAAVLDLARRVDVRALL